MSGLQVVWFALIGLILTGFVVLGGSDLGVGLWYLVTRRGAERHALLNVVAPYWDGNAVWLVAAGALLFAAFPPVYASLVSAMYVPVMLLLFALIFRDVAIEFTGQDISRRWRNAWGVGFGLGSVSVVVVFGVAIGNILRGIPLSASGDFAGTLVGLFNGYSLLIGAAGVAMVATHGALFAGMKTSGEIASRLRRWARISWGFYLALYIAAGVSTVLTNPELVANYRSVPALWILPGLALAALVCTGVFNKLGAERKALGASTVSIVGVMATISAGLFPNLLPALGTPERNLTAYNASSSHLTLTLMLPITLVGMALVVAYTLYVRKPFRGKLDQGDLY